MAQGRQSVLHQKKHTNLLWVKKTFATYLNALVSYYSVVSVLACSPFGNAALTGDKQLQEMLLTRM